MTNTVKVEQVALEPCPFCDGPAEHDARHWGGERRPDGRMLVGHAIYCADMGCIGCPSFSKVWMDDEGGFDEAAAAWNRRHRLASSAGEVEQQLGELASNLRGLIRRTEEDRVKLPSGAYLEGEGATAFLKLVRAIIDMADRAVAPKAALLSSGPVEGEDELPDDFVCTCGAWTEPVNVIDPEHEPNCALVGHPRFTGKVRASPPPDTEARARELLAAELKKEPPEINLLTDVVPALVTEQAALHAIAAALASERGEVIEECARVVEARATACRAAGVTGGICPIEATILDEHLTEAASAIRDLKKEPAP